MISAVQQDDMLSLDGNSFSAIARSVMISAALDTRTCIGVSRFSAIARSVMISALQDPEQRSKLEELFQCYSS